MKKIFCFVSAIILSAIFLYFSLSFTNIIFTGSFSREIMLLCGAIMLASISLLELSNRYFDRLSGYASKKWFLNRWVCNCLFLSLILCFLIALHITFLQGVADENIYIVLLALCVVICAVIFYVQNYRHLRGRKARIRSLERKQLRYKNRRYYCLIHDVSVLDHNVKVTGTVSGKICVNDEVYIYIPASKTVITRIEKIIVDGESVLHVKEGEAELVLKKDALTEKIQRFSVISSVGENVEMNQVNLVENPFLNGLIMGYREYNNDPVYMSTLLWETSSGKYLMAGTSNEYLDGDIMDTISGNINATFHSVSSFDATLTILPVFTDWNALDRWKVIMKEKDAMTILMKYGQVVDIMYRDFDGIVINPFGPFPFYLPKELANSLVKMHKEAEEDEE